MKTREKQRINIIPASEVSGTAACMGHDAGNIPDEIQQIDALDCNKGLDYCGDAEDYMYALETYAGSVDEKAGRLEELTAAISDSDRPGDSLEEYALIVHSLKSMSKSIGAIELSDKAKDLEMAARAGDTEKIKAGTPGFLDEYRGLGKVLCEIISS